MKPVEAETRRLVTHPQALDWWREARFGMFIHWGLYAVPAGEWQGVVMPGIAEWAQGHFKIPHAEYRKFAALFNPVHWDADVVAQLASDAGMKYIVITSKHHDGFAMWDSKISDYCITRATPFGRDPLRELADACARRGLRRGALCTGAPALDPLPTQGRTHGEYTGGMSMTMRSVPATVCRFTRLLHGGDYNPDQWLDRPDILREDLRMMPLANCNVMSVGIFAWTALEPEEGVFTFDWLDRTMDDLAARDIQVVLATPSGARPTWMAAKYPEVLRVGPNRVRNLYGVRHNHCYTSPVYRDKVRLINARLAERYGKHPALLLWHVSNEYGGECHCPLCQEAFRLWLRRRYGDDLQRVNEAWNTSFWSHTYTTWEQIESPAPHGETLVHGHNLDWKRFVTDQTVDFMCHEIEPLRQGAPGVPVTTNLMGDYPGLNYWKLAPHLDVISWDSYPFWHTGPAGYSLLNSVRDGAESLWPDRMEAQWGLFVAFMHNLNRSFRGGQPFLLMESTPSVTNWQSVSTLKRPGMHRLSSLQAVAHGSDSVMYFQWRKSRGASEKFHGAVVDHAGHEHTRVFRDVAELGRDLRRLTPVAGTATPVEVAVVFDWENRWALEDAKGPRNDGEKRYLSTCIAHAAPFWTQGIPFDVIDMDQDLSRYKLVIAPMLYLLRPGVADRLEAFVKAGGVVVATYLSGWVDENDLCFLGGFPGPLRRVLGLWSEEIDALAIGKTNAVRFGPGNTMGLSGEYPAHIFCDLIHAEGAETLATYAKDFYAGRPAVTVNAFGKGRAYYHAARMGERFLDDFYGVLANDLKLVRALPVDLPAGVTAQRRSDGERDFVFVMNFNEQPQCVNLPVDGAFTDMMTGEAVSGALTLEGFGVRVIQGKASQ